MRSETAKLPDDPVRVAAGIVATMEAQAANGDWDGVEETATRLRVAILEVPERDRRPILLAARQSIRKVHSRVEAVREEVASRIAVLRRGKDMAAAYGAAD